jgi:dTDP-4-dehydrorhamnose reductase
MKKILITGGHGMLASDLASQLREMGSEVLAPSRQELNVLDLPALRSAVQDSGCDTVIHTAAMHVDPCEDSPRDAFRVNAWATRQLAAICEQSGATLVYISTCGLFGDRVKPYSEYDDVVLKTVYARSKYFGEEGVREVMPNHLIIRPGWLFGGSPDHGKNFVFRRYEEARSAAVMQSACDKFGSPTLTSDLASRVVELASQQIYGTYHVANSGRASRADYVRGILRAFRMDTPVEDVDSSAFPRKADVPDCEVLACLNSAYSGLDDLPPWQEAIERYVAGMKARFS